MVARLRADAMRSSGGILWFATLCRGPRAIEAAGAGPSQFALHLFTARITLMSFKREQRGRDANEPCHESAVQES